MKKNIYSVIIFCTCVSMQSQEFTATELLNKSIAYHDPQGVWEQFEGSFFVTMESPNRQIRKSKIELDFMESFFRLTLESEGNELVSVLKDEECDLLYNGSSDFSEEVVKKNRLTCERAMMYKDYYTYLYGLPMKLKNPGTILNPVVTEKEVAGVSCWVLKVTYDPDTGEDTWYFYFDKNTYQLRQYQFFHDETKNDGEYIVLENEIEVNGIKMPKDRAWYYNKQDKYLGTDYLSL